MEEITVKLKVSENFYSISVNGSEIESGTHYTLLEGKTLIKAFTESLRNGEYTTPPDLYYNMDLANRLETLKYKIE